MGRLHFAEQSFQHDCITGGVDICMVQTQGTRTTLPLRDVMRGFTCSQAVACCSGLLPSLVGVAHVAIQFPLYEALKTSMAGDEHKELSPFQVVSNVHLLDSSFAMFDVWTLIRDRAINSIH